MISRWRSGDARSSLGAPFRRAGVDFSSPLRTVSLPTKQPAQEFRQYRRLVSWTTLSIIALGSLYLLLSVSVSLYRRRHALPAGDEISARVSKAEMASCFGELRDVSVALRKYLDRSHHLLANDDADELQRWADEGTIWRAQWAGLGRRCRFVAGTRPTQVRREMDAMAAAHEELGNIQTTYTEALKRFAKDLVPRLGRLDRRLAKLGEAIGTTSSPSGENE